MCLVTDRGILLTHGSGKDGCLGHGDRKSVEKPKVIRIPIALTGSYKLLAYKPRIMKVELVAKKYLAT